MSSTISSQELCGCREIQECDKIHAAPIGCPQIRYVRRPRLVRMRQLKPFQQIRPLASLRVRLAQVAFRAHSLKMHAFHQTSHPPFADVLVAQTPEHPRHAPITKAWMLMILQRQGYRAFRLGGFAFRRVLNSSRRMLYEGSEAPAAEIIPFALLVISRTMRRPLSRTTALTFESSSRASGTDRRLESPALRSAFSRDFLKTKARKSTRSLPMTAPSSPLRSLFEPSSFLRESKSFSTASRDR